MWSLEMENKLFVKSYQGKKKMFENTNVKKGKLVLDLLTPNSLILVKIISPH